MVWGGGLGTLVQLPGIKKIIDWILGIRASKDGLFIDPCIPDDWKEFLVKRLYRGTT